MTLALLYDVHGNLAALQAVLEDAQREGAERYVLGGDYTLFGPRPEETIERLKRLDSEHWIRGNCERWMANPDDAPDHARQAIEAARRVLGDAAAVELAGLPESIVVDGTRYVHASPVSDMRSFMPEPGEEEAELLAGVEERRLVFGHTHLPFRREAEGGIELVNPGSVGMPLDGDTRAAYALVREGGEIEHRRVDYDQRSAADDLRRRFGDWAEIVAQRIESARYIT